MENPEAPEEMKRRIKMLAEWIATECDAELEVLWDLFTEHDTSMDGEIDITELTRMLRDFDSGATDEEIDHYCRMLDEDKSGQVEFIELVRWWCNEREQNGSRASSGSLSALLRARFVTMKTSKYTVGLFSKTDWEARLVEISEDVAMKCLANYSKALYQLKKFKSAMALEQATEEERKNIEEMKTDPVRWSEEEQVRLETLWKQFQNSPGGGGGASGPSAASLDSLTMPIADIPRFALLLGYDTPASVVSMTEEVYGDGRMDLTGFMKWWALRPNSGKRGTLF